MDNLRHRPILRALRPHGADRLDPDAQAALAAATADPALAAWLEREQAFDRAFASRVQSVAVPVDLRASIVASVENASLTRTGPRGRGPLVVQRPLATLLAALAAAASLTLLAVVLWPRHSRPAALEDVLTAVVALTPGGIEADQLAGRPLADVRDWLAAQGAPVPGEVPPSLAALPTGGSGTVVLHGVTASVILFEARNVDRGPAGVAGPQLALFTLPRQSCSTQGITREPVVREHDGHTLAVWRDATSIYVLTTDAPAEVLRRLLGQTELALSIDSTRPGGPGTRASHTG